MKLPRQKYYSNSNSELEQREFGVWTSKVVRPWKRTVGRTKAKVYKKLTNSAANNEEALDIALRNRQKYINPKYSDPTLFHGWASIVVKTL